MNARTFVLIVLAASAGLPRSNTAAQEAQAAREPAAPAYMLKADPKWAQRVDAVLKQLAQPVQFRLPSKATAEEFIANLCADPKFSFNKLTDASGRTVITMSPCVQVRRDVKMAVTEGDTVEGLAVRSGLPRNKADSYKVIQSEGEPPKTVSPGSLKVGDTVVFPEVPVWTHVVAKPDVAADRTAIVKALADAINCVGKDMEACLRRNGIELLNRASVPQRPVPKGEFNSISGGMTRRAPPAPAAVAMAKPASVFATAPASAAIASAAPPPPPPPPSPSPALAAAAPPDNENEPPPDALVPVALEQWPYDVNLLTAILNAAGPSMREPTIIGIADGGLADSVGAPLTSDSFTPTIEWKTGIEDNRKEPNEDDDDDNRLIDDLIGAGVARPVPSLLGTGDVSLCSAPQTSFQGWPLVASHGSVVASIASARPLRVKDPQLSKFLPQLIFFRLVAEEPATRTRDSIFRRPTLPRRSTT